MKLNHIYVFYKTIHYIHQVVKQQLELKSKQEVMLVVKTRVGWNLNGKRRDNEMWKQKQKLGRDELNEIKNHFE